MERLLVLQDLISEYNAEHREKNKNVLRELTAYEPYTLICEGCDIGKIGITLYSVIPFNFVCLKNFVSLIPDGCPYKKCYDDML